MLRGTQALEELILFWLMVGTVVADVGRHIMMSIAKQLSGLLQQLTGSDGDLGDLHFERRPPPPSTHSLLGRVSPAVSTILAAFLAFILAVATLYFCCWTLGSKAT